MVKTLRLNQHRLVASKRTPYCRRLVIPSREAAGASAALALASPRQLAWLFLQPDGVSSSSPEAALARTGQDPEVARVAASTGEFVCLVRGQSPRRIRIKPGRSARAL